MQSGHLGRGDIREKWAGCSWELYHVLGTAGAGGVGSEVERVGGPGGSLKAARRWSKGSWSVREQSWLAPGRLFQVESRAGLGSGTCRGRLRSSQGPVWLEQNKGKRVGNGEHQGGSCERDTMSMSSALGVKCGAKQGIEEGASRDLVLMGSLWLSCRPAPGGQRRSRETGWEPIVASQVRGDGPWSRWHQLGGETGQTPGGSPGHV